MSRRNAGTWRRAGAGAVLAATAAVVLAAGGSLDASFGTGGLATVNAGASQVRDAIAQTDGKILVGGFAYPGGTNEAGSAIAEWVIRRFTSSGDLDVGFGTGGLVRLFGVSGADTPGDLAMDATGRVIAIGTSSVKVVTVTGNGKKAKATYTFPQYATLVRLNANGSLDTSFGAGGVVRTAVSGAYATTGTAAVVQPDGRMVLGGAAIFADSGSPSGTGYRSHPFVARYLASGSLDASFGTDGITLDTRIPDGWNGFAGVASIALQSTGHIVVGGSRYPTPWTVTRFTASGAIDTAFPTIATQDQILGVSVDRFDRIVAGGKTPTVNGGYDARVARYLPDGSADASFGSGGVVTINAYQQESVRTDAVFQADDRIVLGLGAGPAGTHFVSATVRLTDAGALDTTYGSSGWGALIDLGSDTWGNGAAIAPDGGILLGGQAGSTWFVARYAAN